MVRKILGWFIFVLIASFIGFIVWLFFFREEPNVPQFETRERSEDFFPVDSTNNIGENGIVDQDGRSDGTSGRSLIPRLRQLSKVPTAGAISFERLTGTSETFITEDGVEESTNNSITIFRYIERATGHLYETRENTLTQTRLSNTTIPKVYQAEFAPNGNSALLRLIDETDNETVKTISASVIAKSTTTEESFRLVADGYALEGPFLSPNIESAEISQFGISYLVPNSNRGSALITADYNDLSKELLYDAPLLSWNLQEINESKIALTTKADSRLSGFLYTVNKDTKVVTKKLGDILGLTTLVSPNEKWIVYSQSSGNSIDTYALNQETNDVITLGINTLSEKCAFSNTNEDVLFCGAANQPERVPYPESWYQGIVSFNDNLWRVHLDTNEYDQILGDREDAEQSFDITRIVVSPNDDHVMFINKKDLTLWSVDVTKTQR